jgi:hypothetical protein
VTILENILKRALAFNAGQGKVSLRKEMCVGAEYEIRQYNSKILKFNRA